MEILGYFCAVLVGLSLGVLGAGGSILTIPTLIYFFHVDPVHATTYSFFIVGATALIGAIQNVRRGTVQLMPALYFAITGSAVIYFIRNFLIERIPENILSAGDITVTKSIFILIFFSIVMFAAGISMILQREHESSKAGRQKNSILSLMLLGISIGTIIAFAGVGGGFLITPALTLFAGLDVKKAIGTSLCIISLNSFTGFFSSLHLHEQLNWAFLFAFIACTGVGIFTGMLISKKINSTKMKRIFGWFLVFMSVCMLVNELLLKM